MLTLFNRRCRQRRPHWSMTAALFTIFAIDLLSAPPFLPTVAAGSSSASSQSCSITSDMTFLQDLEQKYAHQPTFLQAVHEMALSLQDIFDGHDGAFYQRAFLLMTEPERIVAFRVPWTDDDGNLRSNRGWRVEFSSVLGPYKGGLRFHPSVDEGVLKFLGFEQIFKNALTGLPLGGGKGGADFEPKGKSDGEVRRFCESFMTELYRHIGESTDVPAGDIGVGDREIGFLYGAYKRITNLHGTGVLTGKGLHVGGSPLRPEATGYGLVYMTQLAVQRRLKRPIQGMRVAISGAGNAAQFAAHKLIVLGAKVITMSDSNGVLVFEQGLTEQDWNVIVDAKNNQRVRLSAIQSSVQGKYYDGKTPWNVDVRFDLALPCATQNEIDAPAVQRMIDLGVVGVLEGANMPVQAAAQELLRKHGIMYIPGKASNAGGVGVSGLEMSQNAQRLHWSSQVVDGMLQEMMATIYEHMDHASGSLEQNANRAGFLKVAHAMRDLGWVW